MRCRDASRAIAAPNGAISAAELQAHLAGCPRCAGLAERAEAFDRLWEATRPEPPSPASWEAAWARIDRELTGAEPGAPERPSLASASSPSRPGLSRLPIRLAAGLALTAAAAALLLALNLPDPAPGIAGNGPVRGTLDVAVGHTVLYHVDSDDQRVIQVSEPNPAGQDDLTFFSRLEAGFDSDDYFALFGWFEAMPAPLASTSNDERSSPFDPQPH